jgi:hypothetical protein
MPWADQRMHCVSVVQEALPSAMVAPEVKYTQKLHASGDAAEPARPILMRQEEQPSPEGSRDRDAQ